MQDFVTVSVDMQKIDSNSDLSLVHIGYYDFRSVFPQEFHVEIDG